MISLFKNLDIQFIEFFIDSYLDKNEIGVLGNLFTKNKFLSFFLNNIKDIWIKKKYFIEINYRLITIKKFDSNKYIDIDNYYFLNNIYDNKYYSIIFHYIKQNSDTFNNTDLYPGYYRFYYTTYYCEYYAATCHTEILFKIYKNINNKEYLKIFEIFEYFKKNIEKITFVFNVDYISLNTLTTNRTKIFDKNGIQMNFVSWREKIDTIKNISIADFTMTPFISTNRCFTLHILKFHIDTIKIK